MINQGVTQIIKSIIKTKNWIIVGGVLALLIIARLLMNDPFSST